MAERVGKIRRSHVVTTYGPGAIIDFRAPKTGAPLSGVLAGLEEWDRAALNRKGLMHPQVIHEPRLERRLLVQGFRLPPVKPARKGKVDPSDNLDVLPVVRFPEWLQCPRCNSLRRARDWNCDPGKAERWCGPCSDDGSKIFAVPVRFVVACEDGHLDEFPWKRWIGCNCGETNLILDMDGPGLSGKIVRCRNEGCEGEAKSMEGAFHKDALRRLGHCCLGKEPWIAAGISGRCDKAPRVLQRGASNVYWSISESALDIPPFASDLSDQFGTYWPAFNRAKPEKWADLIDTLDMPTLMGKPAPVILRMLQEWRRALDEDDGKQPIEWAEYMKFGESVREPISMKEFQTEPTVVAPELAPYLSGVVLAKRLREVRALSGFTRIHPPGGMFRAKSQQKGKLSVQPQTWLPAIALRGEGIFLKFDDEALREWEGRKSVGDRVDEFNGRLWDSLIAEVRSESEREDLDKLFVSWRASAARFLLIHAFSHALMRRLSLECGYGSSALRERLYVGAGALEMAGVLIHTGSPDSEGTLGGLVRQGQPDRLWDSVIGAVRENTWCSSDPVCITGAMTLSSPRNGAACHACLLVPETSCQHFNTLLDRAFLVGTPSQPDLGFFRSLVEEYA